MIAGQLLSGEKFARMAERAKVKRFIIKHQDLDHNDLFLYDVEKRCQVRFPNTALVLTCRSARNGISCSSPRRRI